MSFTRLIASVSLLVLTASPAAAQTVHSGAPDSTGSWPTAAPADVGLDGAVLDSIDAEIRSGRFGYVDAFLVIRHGKLVYDRHYAHDYAEIYGDSARLSGSAVSGDRTGPYNYFASWWHPYYRGGLAGDDLHTLQSVTKAVSAMVIGVAVTRGDFPPIDTPVLSFFDPDSVANVDARKRRMTIRDLLTMTAGLEWNSDAAYGSGNTADSLEASCDWVKFTIDRPMSDEPGTRYEYNDGAAALLAYVFARATGRDIESYAARHLFAPLGIRRWYWKRTPTGLADTEGGLYMAPEDLAKLWYLYARGGEWDGKRVVSRDWIRESLAPADETFRRPGWVGHYGFQLDLIRSTTDSTLVTWSKTGYGGQLALAVPRDDLIVVLNQWIIPAPPRVRLGGPKTLMRILDAVTDRPG